MWPAERGAVWERRQAIITELRHELCTNPLRMRDLLTCACAVDMGEEVHVYPASPDLRELMCESAKLIIGYQWVWDIQMTKFFQLQHWNKIPTEVCHTSVGIGYSYIIFS